jgi:hypothetical protein
LAALSPDAGARLFWASAIGAVGLHIWVLFGTGPLHGGGDLQPHLRLIQRMADEPALRTTYAPAYHAVGALFASTFGLGAYPKWFGLAAAVGLLAGFRSFQRAARLPDAASALFAWSPYAFSLSWCLPKIEAAGYAIAFAALALLLRRRYVALALALVATFWVHTAAALFLGLCGGTLAALRRDSRALGALAVGTLGSVPLVWSHLAAGCSLAESLLFSPGDYLRSGPLEWTAERAGRLLALAGPIGVAAATAGVARLWRHDRDVAGLCAVVIVLYLNELWLTPFGIGTTLNLQRGLTIAAFPIAIAAGLTLAAHARWSVLVVGACAVWALVSTLLVVPGSCYTQPMDLATIERLDVDRCLFRWYGSTQQPDP